MLGGGGDVTLHETECGKEFLEFNERQTKTRDGSHCCDVRPVTPKMFATDGSEKILLWFTNILLKEDLNK